MSQMNPFLAPFQSSFAKPKSRLMSPCMPRIWWKSLMNPQIWVDQHTLPRLTGFCSYSNSLDIVYIYIYIYITKSTFFWRESLPTMPRCNCSSLHTSYSPEPQTKLQTTIRHMFFWFNPTSNIIFHRYLGEKCQISWSWRNVGFLSKKLQRDIPRIGSQRPPTPRSEVQGPLIHRLHRNEPKTPPAPLATSQGW